MTDTPKRKVCIVTGTRAEWGLLSPLARSLSQRPDVELQIIATNMHLIQRYGHTVDRIRDDGFTVNAEVPMEAASDSETDTARAMGECLQGMASAFASLSPDLIVILGDRYEMLAVCSAATVMRIPIVHLHGGEISEGAIDDSIRHAITKLSALHLTSAEPHRRRVIQMGEDPAMVHTVGAIGVTNALSITPLPTEELERDLGITINRRTLLVPYHPVTTDNASPAILFNRLLAALELFPDSSVIFTYPNNDARGSELIPLIHDFVKAHPHRAIAVPSLGMKRYMSALHYVGAVVGNSSSGIIEVPSMGIPTVNIGNRQQGRLAAASVIHCPDSTDAISDAIASALSSCVSREAANTDNPYHRPDTIPLATTLIAETPLQLLRHKRFHDIRY